MHKGLISVKSEIGKGTEFIIMLPITVAEEQEDMNYLDKQIISDKVQNSIDKIEIEFSDIYS